jgi:hypothetical protein
VLVADANSPAWKADATMSMDAPVLKATAAIACR